MVLCLQQAYVMQKTKLHLFMHVLLVSHFDKTINKDFVDNYILVFIFTTHKTKFKKITY